MPERPLTRANILLADPDPASPSRVVARRFASELVSGMDSDWYGKYQEFLQMVLDFTRMRSDVAEPADVVRNQGAIRELKFLLDAEQFLRQSYLQDKESDTDSRS